MYYTIKYIAMNISKLQRLISESGLNKVQLAEKCGFTRVTLDNLISGGDAKISTVESLAKVLGVSVGCLFDEEQPKLNFTGNDELDYYKREVERLQSLLNSKRTTKVLVELDVDDAEFIKMGLKDKVIQILNK